VPTRAGARPRPQSTEALDDAALAREVSRHLKVKRKELRGLSVPTLRKLDALIFDSLTGTLRREFGYQSLEDAVAGASAPGDLSILFLDADGLKETNDTQGYAAGDALIVAIIDAAETVGIPRRQIARLGGDEFLAILPGTDLAGADALRQGIAAELSPQGRSVSAGATQFGGAGDTADAMVRRAQGLMKAEKQTRPQNRDYQGPAIA
jgi:diguanylate cyclase (GGDEF)-like protein